MKRTIIILFLPIFLFLNCKKNSNHNSELRFKKKVFIDVFPDLITYLKKDSRVEPPAPITILDENFKNIGYDTIEYQERLSMHRKVMKELLSETSKIVIAFNDTIYNLSKFDLDIFKEYLYSDKNANYDSLQESKLRYKFNIDELKKDSIVDFKYLSEFPKETKIWNQEYPFHLNGKVKFSRIYFDKSKNYGILKYSITCGKLCGGTKIAFLENENGKWKIDKEILIEIFE